jgi:hypothetical protein
LASKSLSVAMSTKLGTCQLTLGEVVRKKGMSPRPFLDGPKIDHHPCSLQDGASKKRSNVTTQPSSERGPNAGDGSEVWYLDEAFRKEHEVRGVAIVVVNSVNQGIPLVPRCPIPDLVGGRAD